MINETKGQISDLWIRYLSIGMGSWIVGDRLDWNKLQDRDDTCVFYCRIFRN